MAEIEGFLCPLCMQDCRSVQELEAHYREQHNETSGTAKFKKDFISFFEQVGSSLKLEASPRPKRAELGSRNINEEGVGSDWVPVGPVNNVSGIDPLEWDPQEMGQSFLVMMNPLRRSYLVPLSVHFCHTTEFKSVTQMCFKFLCRACDHP